jgi:hypothetical protein
MLADAAAHWMLVKLKCTLRRRVTYCLPADLIAVYGNQPLFDFRLECSRDGADEFVHADIRTTVPGDVGHLPIRRPGPPVTTRKWHTVKLGDEVVG